MFEKYVFENNVIEKYLFNKFFLGCLINFDIKGNDLRFGTACTWSNKLLLTNYFWTNCFLINFFRTNYFRTNCFLINFFLTNYFQTQNFQVSVLLQNPKSFQSKNKTNLRLDRGEDCQHGNRFFPFKQLSFFYVLLNV